MYVLPPNALINYPLSRPTAVASYLKDLKVHDVIQLALWVGVYRMSRFLGGRCFGIGVEEYGRESKSGLTTRAIHSRDFSAFRLRELGKERKKGRKKGRKKKEEEKKKRKISGTKDFGN